MRTVRETAVEAVVRRRAQGAANVQLCQGTALRTLQPHRDADDRTSDPRFQPVLGAQDKLVLLLCRLGLPASEVVEIVLGLHPRA